MRRRDFLRATAGSTAGVLGWQLGVWSAAASLAEAQESATDEPRGPEPWEPAAELARLRASVAAARAGRKPLLVLVLPDDRLARTEHGSAWGQLVRHGPPRAVAALATCELACARTSAILEVVGDAARLPGPPSAALVLELDANVTRPIHVDLAVTRRGPFPSDTYEESLERRLERVSVALLDAIAPDRETLDARLAATARDLGIRGDDDESAIEKLARATAARLARTPPSGAAWADATGCGIRVDHPRAGNRGGPCGTGHVPKVAKRFLYYLVDLKTR